MRVMRVSCVCHACVMCMYTFVAFMNVRVCECMCVSACV